jgi:hypothetical protein
VGGKCNVDSRLAGRFLAELIGLLDSTHQGTWVFVGRIFFFFLFFLFYSPAAVLHLEKYIFLDVI